MSAKPESGQHCAGWSGSAAPTAPAPGGGCRTNQGPWKDVPRRLPQTEDRPHRRPHGRRRGVGV